MFKAFGIIIGIMIALIIFVVMTIIVIIAKNDDIEIDNMDNHIICSNTSKPCIKDKLYTKWDNCNECIYKINSKHKKEK